MYLLSSAQQGSDTVFTFTTLLGTKPMTYGKFTKSLKWLLKSQVWGQAIVVTGTKALDHYGSSILVTPHVSVNIVKMVY